MLAFGGRPLTHRERVRDRLDTQGALRDERRSLLRERTQMSDACLLLELALKLGAPSGELCAQLTLQFALSFELAFQLAQRACRLALGLSRLARTATTQKVCTVYLVDVSDSVPDAALEDARAEGKTLAEAAEMLKLPVRTIAAIDRSGRDANGNPVNLPDQQRLLPAIFSTDIGIERDPLQFQDGYLWYDVTGITPSQDRSLDEVKEQVETRWRQDQIAAKLREAAGLPKEPTGVVANEGNGGVINKVKDAVSG